MNSINIIDILMNIGTTLSLLSVIPQFKSVIYNKNNLKGYSISGSLMLSLAMISFGIAFYFMSNIYSLICNIFVSIFWVTVSFYLIKNKNKVIKE